MSFDLLSTLRDLVATPSVNPMGRDVAGPEFYEHRLTDYLEQLFARLGIPTWRQPIAPQRDNLLARLDGDPPLDSDGALVLMEAHQDTVPVDGMTIPPFDPQVRDGRLYGRGACDIKGGMTAMLAALARLADQRPTPRPTLIMACTVNEEHGFTGATGLCELWSAKSGKACPLLPRRPAAAIVAEPTNLQVVVAHKGMIRWRCHTLGRAAHSSQPQQGENAVFRMARVLRALEHYQREIVGTLSDHPLCGRPTLSVGTIHGGISVNTVPDRCTIEIDRRLSPSEDPQAAWQHVVHFLAGETSLGSYIEHEPPFMQSRGLGDADNAAVADRLASAVQSLTGKAARKIGVAFGTDAASFAAAGVPCVVFGPGSIQQAHTAEEWVPLAEVQQAADVLYQALANWK